ncbi:MAG: hypothetical protein HWD63_00075 [Candidatus Parvibacillus calidus]|nr:MAG: hypothetical protein HWD63_00075 [Candidatus Parvibacillus calidus]
MPPRSADSTSHFGQICGVPLQDTCGCCSRTPRLMTVAEGAWEPSAISAVLPTAAGRRGIRSDGTSFAEQLVGGMV